MLDLVRKFSSSSGFVINTSDSDRRRFIAGHSFPVIALAVKARFIIQQLGVYPYCTFWLFLRELELCAVKCG